MPKVKGEIKFVYEWQYLSDSKNIGSGDIKNPKHIQALHESAEEQIREAFSKEGKFYGDLKDNIYMGDDDPEDGVDYIGQWRTEISQE